MSEVENLERAVEQLSHTQLAEFRCWFAKFDADAWDAQMETDASGGKLDNLVREALDDYQAGTSREL